MFLGFDGCLVVCMAGIVGKTKAKHWAHGANIFFVVHLYLIAKGSAPGRRVLRRTDRGDGRLGVRVGMEGERSGLRGTAAQSLRRGQCIIRPCWTGPYGRHRVVIGGGRPHEAFPRAVAHTGAFAGHAPSDHNVRIEVRWLNVQPHLDRKHPQAPRHARAPLLERGILRA